MTSSEMTPSFDYSGHGLVSTRGAERVIADLKSKRFISRLLLAHNILVDDGCCTLFRYLVSGPAVAEIVLASNHIGNIGLLAIIEYLNGNRTLKKLSLQNNKFISDTLINRSFVDAVNSSSLEALQLATNPGLADPFIETFLPHLNAPVLLELNISSMHLSPTSLPHIISYLSSPHRCRLESFGCSANVIGTPGVKAIIAAVGKHNYRLRRLDIFSNQGDTEDVDSPESLSEWRTTYALLQRVLIRNAQMKRATEDQSLRLLRYARILLLYPASSTSLPSSDHHRFPTTAHSPHRVLLPTEVKQYILSFFAPDLSSVQRVNIYAYAASLATLPKLLPRLTSPMVLDKSPACSVRHCTGVYSPAVNSRQYSRERWLAAMGCDVYQPEGRDHS